MSDVFVFEQNARTRRTFLIVICIWLVLLAALIWLQASAWIVVFLGAFTLPAVADMIRNPKSGLSLDAHSLSWFSGRRHAALELSEIDHVRLDTRLDFSVRVTAVLTSGRKVRLPFESTPPHQALEDALHARGLKTARHHFQLLQ